MDPTREERSVKQLNVQSDNWERYRSINSVAPIQERTKKECFRGLSFEKRPWKYLASLNKD